MAEIKAGQAEGVLNRPDARVRLWLVFGTDPGLVGERVDRLVEAFAPAGDAFARVRVDADAAAADPGLLSDEAHAISMFGGTRVIRVGGTTRRNLAEAVKPLIERPPADAYVVIEAGDLKRDAALRKLFAAAPMAVAIPCYPDAVADLDRLIDTVLGEARLRIGTDARARLRDSLGADRRLSRGEIEKLALYCMGQAEVALEDVEAVVGDTASHELDEAIDAALLGDVERMDRETTALLETGQAPDMLAIMALRHVQGLAQARAEVEGGRTAAAVIAALRPPLHFARRDGFARMLGLWSGEALERAAARLHEASFSARSQPLLSRPVVHAALLALALEARHAARSRRRA